MGDGLMSDGEFLIRLEGSQTAEKYIQMIEDYEIFSLIPNQHIFQQDNPRNHTAEETKDYMREQKICLLDWPAQSPDLSPIENYWSYLKDKLYNLKDNIRNKDDLWQEAQNIFYSVEMTEFIQKIIQTMPQRMKEAIQAEGNQIIN